MMLGAAGWGLASLHLYRRLGAAEYLDWSVKAGDHLLATARGGDRSCHWVREQDQRVHYGFGYGASGIALFLLHLGQATGADRYLDTAVRALQFDIEHRVESDLGWLWHRFEQDSMVRPYWIHGSAGIRSTAIRFFELTGEPHYLEIAERIAHGSFVKFTVTPGLFEGLSGIGEFMLDMFRATRRAVYRDHALDMAETIGWFKVEHRTGVAWPERR
jgi:lantibiotic modifying enzyme